MLKAIVLHDDNSDVFRLLRMGCAEAKKSLGIRDHVKPIDYIKRPYGHIIVVQLPNKLYENLPGVRKGKKDNE